MFGIFHTANWLLTIGAVFIFAVTAHVITRLWKRHRSDDGQRAIERLSKLGGKKPAEAVKPELTQRYEFEVQKPDDLGLSSESEPKTNQELPLHDPAGGRAAPDCEALQEPKQAKKQNLSLPVGTKVQAIRNFGPVKKGVPGIVTDVTAISFLWWSRPMYLCTFANNIKVHAPARQIAAYQHGYSIEELEQPDFASNLSRQMTLRAEQLFCRPRATRLRNAIIRSS
jgi:hypothetical protein